MHIGIPQIILVILYVLSLGISLAKHGETMDRKYNFFTTLIATVILMFLLAWGGFFT